MRTLISPCLRWWCTLGGWWTAFPSLTWWRRCGNSAPSGRTPAVLQHVVFILSRVLLFYGLRTVSVCVCFSYVVLMPNKRQALVEYEDQGGSCNAVTYANDNQVYIAGRPCYINYSTSQKISRPGDSGDAPSVNNILLFTIMNPIYPITTVTCHNNNNNAHSQPALVRMYHLYVLLVFFRTCCTPSVITAALCRGLWSSGRMASRPWWNILYKLWEACCRRLKCPMLNAKSWLVSRMDCEIVIVIFVVLQKCSVNSLTWCSHLIRSKVLKGQKHHSMGLISTLAAAPSKSSMPRSVTLIWNYSHPYDFNAPLCLRSHLFVESLIKFFPPAADST